MKSLSRRAVGLTSSISVLGVLVLAVFVYSCIQMWQSKQQEEVAGRALQAVETLLQKPAGDFSAQSVAGDLREILMGQGVTQAKIFDSAGQQVYGPEVFFNGSQQVRLFHHEFAQPRMQLMAKRVELAVDTENDARFLNFISGVFVSFVLLWALVSVVLSRRVVQMAIRPINRLTSRLQALGTSSLDNELIDTRAPVELHPFIQGFNDLLSQLRANREQLKSFNSNVAHELNTPLSSLTISHELLQRRDSLSGEEFQKVLNDHLGELTRMNRIIRSMLFLANATQGRELNLQYVSSLNRVVSSVAEYLEQLAEEQDLTIQVRGDAQVYAEIELIKRAVSNLVSNAIRYAKAGSVITVVIESESDLVAIKVKNEGAEVPQDRLAKFFEPFFRAEGGRSQTGEHHGLGLAIVEAIAKLHGGAVNAFSGGGCTEVAFSIRHIKKHK